MQAYRGPTKRGVGKTEDDWERPVNGDIRKGHLGTGKIERVPVCGVVKTKLSSRSNDDVIWTIWSAVAKSGGDKVPIKSAMAGDAFATHTTVADTNRNIDFMAVTPNETARPQRAMRPSAGGNRTQFVRHVPLLSVSR